MKKILTILIAVMLIFSVALYGCNTANPADNPFHTEGGEKPDGDKDTPVVPDVPDDGEEPTPEPKPEEPEAPDIPDVPDDGEEPTPEPKPEEPEVPDIPDVPDDGEEPVPEPKPEEPEVPDIPDGGETEHPSQNPLLSGITETLWKDGENRYAFEEDGSVTVYNMDAIYFNITSAHAAFQWKYSENLLYFFDDSVKDLVTIETVGKETINSTQYNLTLTRTDAVFLPMTVYAERNNPEEITAVFESGTVVYKSDYLFFGDEMAKENPTAESERIFAYPNTIHTLTISMGEEYENIVLHSFISDNYILHAGFALPKIEDENFDSWQYNQTSFHTLYEVVDFMIYNNQSEITLQPHFIPVVKDLFEGTYWYKNKFRFVAEKSKFFIYDANGMEIAVYNWKNENGYYLYTDDSNVHIGDFVSVDENTYYITGTEIKDLLSIKVGKVTMVREK